MTTTTTDVRGPVDFILLELPRDGLAGGAATVMEPGTVAALIVHEPPASDSSR